MSYAKLFNYLTATMNQVRSKSSISSATWFVCFGGLLRYVRDKGDLSNESDLDIGILFEEYDHQSFERAISGKFFVEKKILHSSGKPLYYHLGDSNNLGKSICVFAFIKYQNLRFHTFDIQGAEGFRFKGMPAECLNETVKVNFPDTMQNINIPLHYGSCLDWWYYDWLKPRKGESETRWLIEMDHCKQFEKGNFKKLVSKHGPKKYRYGEEV